MTAHIRCDEREEIRRKHRAKGDLDCAIRLINRAEEHEKYARYGHAMLDRDRAGRIFQHIGTWRLQLDPEAKP